MSLATNIDIESESGLQSYLHNMFLTCYGEDLYITWFENILVLQDQTSAITLTTPSAFIQKWIMNNYISQIRKWCTEYDDKITEISWKVSTKYFNNFTDIPKKQCDTNDLPNTNSSENNRVIHSDKSLELITPSSIGAAESYKYLSTLDPRFSFENFIVGKPNELAYAAALSVAESHSSSPKSNPLFLYGGVGLGKTHLMHAIAWHVKEHNPHRKIIYMSAEKFMYEFVRALRMKDVLSFKEYFRSVDILMIDDIQFICGKDSTQEEFFHTFNALIDNNKQIVISCDRSPADLNNIEDRIKSRLGWGLVADVHSTTYELRLSILQSKVEKLNVIVPQDVLEFLADKIVSNVRELEGALNKVIAHSHLSKSFISLENTQYLLRDLIKSNNSKVTIELIQNKIAEVYDLKISDLSSPRRMRNIARPRQIAMYLCKQLTTKSLMEIGRSFNKKDHTTVIHAIKTIEDLMHINHTESKKINAISRSLQC